MEQNNNIYYSERSTWLGFTLLGLLIGLIFLFFYTYEKMAYIVLIAVSVFIGIIWFGTKYHVVENYLVVKIWFFTHSKIDINNIKSIIKKSNNLMASPANSFKRMAINYDEHNQILLSPKRKELFIEELLKINPLIKIID